MPQTPTHTSLSKTAVTIASYEDYEHAQRAVDYLSDEKFPVEHTQIIGTDLRLVENVTGRLTWGKTALAGAGTGVWFGALIGLLFSLFSDEEPWAIIAAGIVVGLVGGLVFSLAAYAMTGGKRDFTSRSALAAGRYDVVVALDYADQASTTLAGLDESKPVEDESAEVLDPGEPEVVETPAERVEVAPAATEEPAVTEEPTATSAAEQEKAAAEKPASKPRKRGGKAADADA